MLSPGLKKVRFVQIKDRGRETLRQHHVREVHVCPVSFQEGR